MDPVYNPEARLQVHPIRIKEATKMINSKPKSKDSINSNSSTNSSSSNNNTSSNSKEELRDKHSKNKVATCDFLYSFFRRFEYYNCTEILKYSLRKII